MIKNQINQSVFLKLYSDMSYSYMLFFVSSLTSAVGITVINIIGLRVKNVLATLDFTYFYL